LIYLIFVFFALGIISNFYVLWTHGDETAFVIFISSILFFFFVLALPFVLPAILFVEKIRVKK